MPSYGRRSNMDTASSGRPQNTYISNYEAVMNELFTVVSPLPDAHANVEVPVIDPGVITVKDVDLDVSANASAHNTNQFDIVDGTLSTLLVVRRGQKFNLSIEFDREYNKDFDDVRIVFQFGKEPVPTMGTRADILLSDRDDWMSWGAFIKSKNSNIVQLEVMTPPDCPVGKWNMSFDVVKRSDKDVVRFRYAHTDPIYILFNPWCKDDLVYFPEEDNEKLLNEYVLNEAGAVYCGSAGWIGSHPWTYSQFTGNILDCVMVLLDESSLRDYKRGDPVLVSRKLTALVNSNDGSGILSGRWGGDYTGGTSPLDWNGSAAIFEEYYRTRRAVCYGQCWIFSGVLTTACRALGIPCRSITNFASAHDTDGSVTIDTYVDSDAEKIESLTTDSTWNFHCWNDAWMARPDLPPGYGGWQAIDATPQEASDGVYRAGPMSLTAIKRGEVHLPYDGKFIFAEVNGDRVTWAMDDNFEMVVTKIDRSGVGKYISTTKPLHWRNARQDITDQYKHPEGSEEERAAVRRAGMTTADDRNLIVYKPASAEDVTFEIVPFKDTFIGDVIDIKYKITNTGTEDRTINGALLLSSIYYTGLNFRNIKKEKIENLTLKSKEEKVLNITVSSFEYLENLTDHCLCILSTNCNVKETKQMSTDSMELRLKKPDLEVQGMELGVIGEKMEIEVSFLNPIYQTLTKCHLRVEGPHLQRPIIYKQEDVAPYSMFRAKFDVIPSSSGFRELMVSFNCRQIYAVTGTHFMVVRKKDD